MFSQSVIVLSYMLLWGGSVKKMDTGRLDRLLRKAGYVLGIDLMCIPSIAEKRRLNWMMAILDTDPHWTHIQQTAEHFQCQTSVNTLRNGQDEEVLCPLGAPSCSTPQKGRREMDFSA